MYCLGLGLVISLQVWYSIARDVHVDSINMDWRDVTALVWAVAWMAQHAISTSSAVTLLSRDDELNSCFEEYVECSTKCASAAVRSKTGTPANV